MINPAKLKSLVDQQSAGPNMAALGAAPPEPGGAPEDEEGLDDEEGDGEPADPIARGNELLAEWGEYGVTLGEEADMFAKNAEDIGAELLLEEIPPDILKDVGKTVDRMPDEIQQGLAKYCADLSPDDLDAVAAALADKLGEKAGDIGMFTAYLQAAATYAGEEVEVEEEEEPEEEEEEEEDVEEEDPEADAPPDDAPPE